MSVKRGRPRKQPQMESDLFIATQALRDIASGEMLKMSLATLGRTWESVGPESEAFVWAQAYAKGALKRLGIEP